jgi:NADPH:quinone reductase-like Zn-dependent oxidoreductase
LKIGRFAILKGDPMYAAVVSSFDTAPRYAQIPTPEPDGKDEVLVDVIAAGLHPRVRSQANGSHYTSSGELPLVPGIDGVGRASDGALRYFIASDATIGTMAEQTVVDLRRSVVLHEGSDPLLVAAAMNPAMSSWVALRRRIDFRPGQQVLVLGATGNAGQLAVQVARHLGAGRIVAAGRDAARLANLSRLGADLLVSLGGDREEVAVRLGEAAGEVDVVIDYLWGEPTATAMLGLARYRASDKPLSWIEIGSVAGPTAEIPSAALRAHRLQIVGSGQGSVSTADIVAELPLLADAISAGTFEVNARAVPLAQVTRAWQEPDGGGRVVLTPGR